MSKTSALCELAHFWQAAGEAGDGSDESIGMVARAPPAAPRMTTAAAARTGNRKNINKCGVDVLASLGEKNPKYKTVHHYHVNVSGDFGARRLMFRSKFKRDEFLSILRAIQPNVRITRWS